MLTAAGEQHGRDAVDGDADRGDRDHRLALGRRRMEQAADRFRADRADRDQQEQRSWQRRQDRRLLEPVGEPRRGRALGHDRARPGDHQAEHVRQIVAGVGEQRHRIGEEAVNRLDRDEAEVERDADREGAAEIPLPMRVVMMMTVMMVVPAHCEAD